jgi:hypothetical protein
MSLRIGFWIMIFVAAVNALVAVFAAVAGSWRASVIFAALAGGSVMSAFSSFRHRPRRKSGGAAGEQSLVLRRMELDRRRTQAVASIAVVVLFSAVAAAAAARVGELDGFVVAGAASILVVGGGYSARLLIENVAQRRAFESEHGADAGKQDPI